MSGPSTFGLIAAGLYCVTGSLGALAAWRAGAGGHAPRHVRLWLLVALAFVLLALSRVTMAEDVLHGWLRGQLEGMALYEHRRTLQLPLVLLTTAAAFASLAWWLAIWRRISGRRRERMVHLAWLGLLGMGSLIVLRIVSLHGIDSWLYSGLRLNWWLDIGSSLVVGSAAIRYLWLLRVAVRGN